MSIKDFYTRKQRPDELQISKQIKQDRGVDEVFGNSFNRIDASKRVIEMMIADCIVYYANKNGIQDKNMVMKDKHLRHEVLTRATNMVKAYHNIDFIRRYKDHGLLDKNGNKIVKI